MNPADLTLNISPSLTTKTLTTPQSAATQLKNGRIPVPRVDIEPIYTQLKSALGDQWPDYKMAVGQFILGNLNQAELSWVLQPLLSPAQVASTVGANGTTLAAALNAATPPPSTLQLHNTLIAAIYANTLRDAPPSDVAPWVVATDKPAATAKNAGASGANDKAEERLKKEVMSIHARDRRRIKTLKEGGAPVNDGFNEMQSYRQELAVKPPDVAPQSAGGAGAGITKTSWDIEIRRRYAQPLAQETLEFPALGELQNRIEPICYEEGVTGGVAAGALQTCAELVEQASEVFLKELIGELCAHARSNADRRGIHTAAHRRQLRREEGDAERGSVQRSPAGLLPAELLALAQRQPLSMHDMRLAVQLHDPYLRPDPFLSEKISLTIYPGPSPEALEPPKTNGLLSVPSRLLPNGSSSTSALPSHNTKLEDHPDVVDDGDFGWRGGSRGDADDLMGALEECLAVG